MRSPSRALMMSSHRLEVFPWNASRAILGSGTSVACPSRFFTPQNSLASCRSVNQTLYGFSGRTCTANLEKIPLHCLKVILCFLLVHNVIKDPEEKEHGD